MGIEVGPTLQEGFLSRQTFDRIQSDHPPSWRWRAILPALTGFSENSFEVVIEEIGVPFETVDTNSTWKAGARLTYPGSSSVAAIPIVMYEDRKFTATSYLNFWTRLRFDKLSGTFRPARIYKQPIYIRYYSISNSETPLMEQVLWDCWPLGQEPLQLNYNSSGRLVVQCNFACDESQILRTGRGVTQFDVLRTLQ